MSGRQYRVGAAKVEITPSLQSTVYLAGFAPGRTATSIAHPLELSALALFDQRGLQLVLVSADLIGLLNPVVQRIRSRVAHVVPPERLLVCATHTHSGPDTLGLWGPSVLGLPFRSGVNPDYLGSVVEAAGRAVEDAVAASRPVTLTAGAFATPPHWVRNERKGGEHFTKAVTLCAHDDQGPYAILLNFAAHPEALWEDNRAISPDYPGPCRQRLRELGWRHPLFFSGPLGAMLTPAVPSNAGLTERRRFVDYFGRMLAELAHGNAHTNQELSGAITVASQRLRVVNANRNFGVARRMGFIDRPMADGTIQTEIMAARIGPLRLASIPGEPAPEIGHQVVRALGGEPAMILALGLDELGYILPAAAFRNRAYRYEQTMSVGPHMAGTVVETIARLTEQLDHA